MALTLREPVSTLAKEIMPAVKAFILTNQNMMINNPKTITPDDGATALSNAICYAVAKAIVSQTFLTALKLGICPGTVPGTAGTLIANALILPPKEL